jgi:hypothetical protein
MRINVYKILPSGRRINGTMSKKAYEAQAELTGVKWQADQGEVNEVVKVEALNLKPIEAPQAETPVVNTEKLVEPIKVVDVITIIDDIPAMEAAPVVERQSFGKTKGRKNG